MPLKRFPQLWFYSFLSRGPFPRSYPGKLLLIGFLGTHVPLIAFLIFALFELNLSAPLVQESIVLLVLATVSGTLIALFAIQAMMAPIDAARVALSDYRENGHLPRLPVTFRDSPGVLLREVDATISRLHDVLRDLAHEARTDPLTGVGNRRALMEEGRRRMGEAAAQGGSFLVAIVDLDGFKAVNDRFGHSAGDLLLTTVAAIMREAVGQRGIVGRLGGDEFCILLPRLPLADAVVLLEGTRIAIASVPSPPIPPGSVTASFGVAEMHHHADETFAQLLSRADLSVYRAKDGGRNRVVALWPDAAGDPEPAKPAG